MYEKNEKGKIWNHISRGSCFVCGGLSACSAKAAASADHTAKETTSADGTATETVSGEKKTIRYGKSQGPYTELFEAAVFLSWSRRGIRWKERTFPIF